MSTRRHTLPAALCLLAAAAAANAQDIREQRVDLSGGRAVIEGRLTGREIVDYKLALAPGTPLIVSLETDHLANYFNLLPPGSADVAFFIGSTEGNRFEGTVEAAGDYTARVYLMRSAARRGEQARYRIDIAIGDAAGDYADGDAGGPDFWEVANLSPGSTVNLRSAPSTSSAVLLQFANGAVLRNLGCRRSMGERWCEVALPGAPHQRGFVHGAYLREGAPPPADATVGDTGYHAVGAIPCGTASCAFGVVRRGGGTAVVTVDTPGGERVLHFERGEPVTVEGGAAFEWSRSSDTTVITIEGGEPLRIPDAVVSGG